MDILAQRILKGVSELPAEYLQLRFGSVRDSYSNGLKNNCSQSPSSQIPYYMSLLLRERRFSHTELLKAVQGISFFMRVA